ncbi:MAG: hypothetical protein MR416_05165, partial [Lachnospiraceae bacterium]|nr:hypothetical protein [Lachnospiraceae bacterium]
MQINTVCGNGSVGKIAVDLKHTLEAAGHSCQILYGRKKAPDGVSAVRIGSDLSMGVHVLDTFFKGEH